METDFRASFFIRKLLLKLGGIQFAKSIPATKILFLLRETDLPVMNFSV